MRIHTSLSGLALGCGPGRMVCCAGVCQMFPMLLAASRASGMHCHTAYNKMLTWQIRNQFSIVSWHLLLPSLHVVSLCLCLGSVAMPWTVPPKSQSLVHL